MSKFGGSQDKCIKCSKTGLFEHFSHYSLQPLIVYAEEKVSVGNNKIFHEACFRCATCNLKLRAPNYGILDDICYCKTHYMNALQNLKRTAIDGEGEKTAFKPIGNEPAAKK